MRKFSLLAVIGVFQLIACKSPKGLEYISTSDIRFGNALGLKELTFQANLKYYNPNKYVIQVKNPKCDLYVDDVFFGNFQLDTLFKIPRRDTIDFPISVKVPTSQLLKFGFSMLNKDVKFNIKGNVKVGRKGVFINMPLNYEGIQKIEL